MPEMSVNALKGNLGNAQRDYLWEILIPAPVGDGEPDTFLLRGQSASIPEREQGQIKVPFKQTPGFNFPGKLQFAQIWDCTFIEGEDKKTYNAITSWMNQIVDEDTGVGVGDSIIKTDIYLNMITTDNNISSKLKLKGCYIKTRGAVQLSQDTEGIVYYPVSVSYDSVEDVT